MISYNTIDLKSDYESILVDLISAFEGHESVARDTNDGEITIGYGYTFSRSDNLAIWTTAGIELTDEERAILQSIDEAETKEAKNSIALSQFTMSISRDEARQLLMQTYPKYEGPADDLEMPLSYERIALVSITYNRGENAVYQRMGDFFDAVNEGNRAAAWYQIRYNSQTTNPIFQNGIAKRRYVESEIFGLYDDPENVAVDEAKSVYRMYTENREVILDYENEFRSMVDVANNDAFLSEIVTVQDFQQSFDPAYQYLIANYVTDLNSGIAIDYRDIQIGGDGVEILNGTQRDEFQLNERAEQSDLILGEGGNDILSGDGASDILYGGDDDDTLYGGNYADTEDNAVDRLLGGDGFDVYHAGNGDIITDTDDRGRVFYDGAVLVPGLHGSEQDENQYVSLDGRFTYTLNGTDLIVTVNGSEPAVSFTIQDFASGNLGIVLRDMADTSYSSPYQISEAQADGANIVENDNDPNTADFSPAGNDAIIGLAGEGLMVIEPVTQGTVVYGDGPDVSEEQQGTDGIFVDYARFSANVGLEEPNIPLPEEGAMVFAQGGHDWVGGSYDHDWIEGGSGHDALEGGHGDDVLIGGTGNDYIDAGAGSDIVIAAELDDATGNENNLLSGGEGDDTVLGSSGNDWLYGDTRLFGAGLTFESGVVQERYWHGEEFTGNLIQGRLHFWHGIWGVDHLRNGGAYYDPVKGAGDDVLDGGAGDDQAYGGAGNDQITGGAGGDLLVGEAGDDRLTGGDHDDSLFGDFSKLIYQNDNNVIDFDELFDHDLVTRVYRDPVNTAGNDVLDGGAGSDTLQGGHGNDVYVFGRGYGIDGVYDDAGVDRLRLGAEIQTGIEVYKYWSIEEYRIQESEFRRAA